MSGCTTFARAQSAATQMHMHTLTVRTARTDARCCSGIKAHLPPTCTSSSIRLLPAPSSSIRFTPVLHAHSLSPHAPHTGPRTARGLTSLRARPLMRWTLTMMAAWTTRSSTLHCSSCECRSQGLKAQAPRVGGAQEMTSCHGSRSECYKEQALPCRQQQGRCARQALACALHTFTPMAPSHMHSCLRCLPQQTRPQS